MKNLERLYKALANRRRLAILKYLKAVPQAAVGDIAAHIRLSIKATSKHLAILAAIDVLEKEQKGLAVYYFIAGKLSPVLKHSLTLL